MADESRAQGQNLPVPSQTQTDLSLTPGENNLLQAIRSRGVQDVMHQAAHAAQVDVILAMRTLQDMMLNANKKAVNPFDGSVVDLGPDWQNRLRATDIMFRALGLMQGKQGATNVKQKVTINFGTQPILSSPSPGDYIDANATDGEYVIHQDDYSDAGN